MATFAPSPVVMGTLPVSRVDVAPASDSAAMSTPAAAVAPADDSETGEWPDESFESAVRAEQREREEISPADPREGSADTAVLAVAPSEPLPSLEAAIEQIPAEVRTTLEELFRARFTSVQRISPSALK